MNLLIFKRFCYSFYFNMSLKHLQENAEPCRNLQVLVVSRFFMFIQCKFTDMYTFLQEITRIYGLLQEITGFICTITYTKKEKLQIIQNFTGIYSTVCILAGLNNYQ